MNQTENATALIFFLLISVGAIASFVYLLYRRFRILKLAQPINRFDQPGNRLLSILKFFVGQKSILNPRFLDAGIMHAFLFWGFLTVAINSFHFVMGWISPGFHIPGFGPEQVIGIGYIYLRDIFETLVILMVAYAFIRRLIIRPKRLTQSIDAFLILTFVLILMVSDFLMSGAKYSVNEVTTSPAGLLLTRWFPDWWQSPYTVYQVSSWIHLITFFGFLVFLPLSKHFHVVTAIFNIYFKNFSQSSLPKLDIENAENFGTSKLHHFNWKNMLDVYSCTECGRCTSLCPAYATDKPLSPKAINEDIRHYLYQNISKILTTNPLKLNELKIQGDPMVGGVIQDDTLWACTTCKACEDACPLFIEFIDRIISMRRHLVLEEARIPNELTLTFKNLERNSNPWGIGKSERETWTEGLDVPRMREVQGEVDLLFWVGCAGAFDDRCKKISRDLVKILYAAEVDFAILGNEENCTGDLARRAGNEYLFQMLVEANIATLKQYKFKRILTQCPHCFNTLKNEYPQFNANYEVIHHSVFIQEIINEGRLKLKSNKNTISFHDSCYLGRHNNIYGAPRDVLTSIIGTQLKELPRRYNNGFCCGAGGARMWMEENIGTRINHQRVDEIIQIKPNVVATACPFCKTMIDDGLKDKNQHNIKTMDITEIVAESLEI